MYSNSCCSCLFEPEIIKIGQSSHKMCSNKSEFSRIYDNFKCLYKKSQETYLMALVIIPTIHEINTVHKEKVNKFKVSYITVP